MRKAKWRYEGLCMCHPDLSYICPSCRAEGALEPRRSPLLDEATDPSPETVEESEVFSDVCPWNPEALPERLQGYGYLLPDQDGGDGRTWVTPEADHEATFLQCAREIFEVERETVTPPPEV